MWYTASTSPVPRAIEARRLGSGSAVTVTRWGCLPWRCRIIWRHSCRMFCTRSERIVHLHEIAACSGGSPDAVVSPPRDRHVGPDEVVRPDRDAQLGVGP